MNIPQCSLLRSQLWVSTLLMTCCGPAGAWDYHEHVRITEQATTRACAQLGSKTFEQIPLCNSEIARRCFGHAVAISGDHAASPEALLKAIAEGTSQLVREEFDCRQFHSNDHATSAKELPPHHLKLTDQSLFLEYARLASQNYTHFQPDAAASWRQFHARATAGDRRGSPMSLRPYLEMAFALHFLQDAFAAGHNGLQRRPYRQDYGQAYHDDINRHGILLSNDTREWYAYGDRNLDRRSSYIEIATNPTDRPDDHDAAIADHLSQLGFDRTQALTALASFRLSPEPYLVASARPSGGGHVLCTLFDDCDKRQIVLAKADFLRKRVAIDGQPDVCTVEAVSARVTILHCDDTRWHTEQASTDAMTSFLIFHFLSDQEQSTDSFRRADDAIPKRYRSFIKAPSVAIFNRAPVFLRQSDQRPSSEGSEHSHAAARWTLDYVNPRREASLARLQWGLWGTSPNWANGRLTINASTAVVDSTLRFFNHLDAAVAITHPRFRFFDGLVSISPVFSCGGINLFSGRERRAAHFGGGLSLEANFGRHVFALDYQKLELQRFGSTVDRPTKASFSIRIPVLDLLTLPQGRATTP